MTATSPIIAVTVRLSKSKTAARRSENSGKDYVSLSLLGPAFGPKKFFANFDRAAGRDDADTFAILWNPAD